MPVKRCSSRAPLRTSVAAAQCCCRRPSSSGVKGRGKRYWRGGKSPPCNKTRIGGGVEIPGQYHQEGQPHPNLSRGGVVRGRAGGGGGGLSPHTPPPRIGSACDD